jgi:hypothetical protein
MTTPDLDRRRAALDAFHEAIHQKHDGVVACAVRIEDGCVVDFGVSSKDLPDETERLMRKVPRKQMKGRR